jgi:hypothetical protein
VGIGQAPSSYRIPSGLFLFDGRSTYISGGTAIAAIGPIALFDKSFIQSLSVDESLWFDQFFHSVVCPIFFVETLADLAKMPRDGRTAEGEVRIIAAKFPEMHGSPCVEFSELSLARA